MKFLQHDKNNNVFSGLESDIFDVVENVAEQNIDSRTELSFEMASLGYLYEIKFANKVMTDRVWGIFHQHCRYRSFQLKQTGEFYIFNGISDHVALVQLIDNAGNVNKAVIISGCWIYDYNYRRELNLIK